MLADNLSQSESCIQWLQSEISLAEIMPMADERWTRTNFWSNVGWTCADFLFRWTVKKSPRDELKRRAFLWILMETATDGRIIRRNSESVSSVKFWWKRRRMGKSSAGIRNSFQVLNFYRNGDGWAYHPPESGIRFQVFNFDGNADGWAYHPPESGIRFKC